MKSILSLLSILFIGSAQATNYYFSSSIGDDSRNAIQAQNPATPWKSLTKLNAINSQINPGDTISFRRGDVFQGKLEINRAGTKDQPIVFTAYGSGPKPEITGFTPIREWISIGNGIWESKTLLNTNSINYVTVNGHTKQIGRYPNNNTSDGGYLKIQSHTSNKIIANQQLSKTNWDGGEIVIRKNRWILDRNKIVNHSGNTIEYVPETGYETQDNFGYFVQNHIATLDLPGEWFFDVSSQKLKMFFGATNPDNQEVMASTEDAVLIIKKQSNIFINEIKFSGTNINTIDIADAQNISLIGIEIHQSGTNGFLGYNITGLRLQKSSISNTNNNAIDCKNCSDSRFQNNRISGTGMIAGMGKSGDLTYQAMIVEGNNIVIEDNYIDSTGYIPIRFDGNALLIQKNYITNFTMVKDDGGGIYTWKGAENNTANFDRKIINNIILKGKGAPHGTNNSFQHSHGIYIDDNSDNVEISNNSIAECSESGIYIHNSRKITISGNTLFDNDKQLQIVHDNIVPNNPIRDVVLKNNILFSKDAKQLATNIVSLNNDVNKFGKFDSNFYCRPFEDNYVISTQNVNVGQFQEVILNLKKWQTSYKQDYSSKESPLQLSKYELKSIKGNNKFPNGKFDKNIQDVGSWSSIGSGSIKWDNSKILDNGCLKFDFNTTKDDNHTALANLTIGSVKSGRAYAVKFSLLGEKNENFLKVYFRKTNSPYNDISERKVVDITLSRKEVELILLTNTDEPDASLLFEVNNPTERFWIDNISVTEVEVFINDPSEFILFKHNPTNTKKTVPVNGMFLDAKGRLYSNHVEIQPYSSVVLLKHKTYVLPVQLLDFKAKKVNQGVELLWSTTNETDTNNYLIERSEDGFFFTVIDSVQKNGFTNKSRYTYLDKHPGRNLNYYRIKYRGKNDTFNFSEVLKIEMSESNLKIFPNPASSYITFSCSEKLDFKNGLFSIKSIWGQQIKSAPLKTISENKSLDLTSLKSGVYFFEIKSGSFHAIERFVKN